MLDHQKDLVVRRANLQCLLVVVHEARGNLFHIGASSRQPCPNTIVARSRLDSSLWSVRAAVESMSFGKETRSAPSIMTLRMSLLPEVASRNVDCPLETVAQASAKKVAATNTLDMASYWRKPRHLV